MVVAAFVAPYLLDATTRFVQAAARLPDTELALVTCEPEDHVPAGLRRRLAAHWRIDDALDTGQITSAVQGVSERIGPVQRLLAVLEQLQVPVAQARQRLSITGMDAGTARNFRDKAQMKSVLRAAGVPCARYRLADSAAAAAGFAKEVGFPLVVKPPAGSGAKSTFRLDDADDLRVWLDAAPPSPERLALLEEFLSGDEGSYDSVMVDGQIVWDSVSSYLPTPLEVLRNPWIQWMVLLPRAIDGPEYAGIRAIAPAALQRSRAALPGSPTWSGSGGPTARSPSPRSRCGRPAPRSPRCCATPTTSTCTRAWAQLMVHGTFAPPERDWSAGTVFLRGQGTGHVRAVHGLDGLPDEVSSIVVESRLPEPGQLSSGSYEGDGYVIVRHRDTAVVTDAMWRLVTGVRVELG